MERPSNHGGRQGGIITSPVSFHRSRACIFSGFLRPLCNIDVEDDMNCMDEGYGECEVGEVDWLEEQIILQALVADEG